MARKKRDPAVKTEKQKEIDGRRTKVATLMAAGKRPLEIANALDVSPATITSDIKAIIKFWQESFAVDVTTAMALDLERVEIALRSIWLQVTGGNLLAIDRMERLIRLRKEVIGYGWKPDNLAADPNWQPITVIEVIKDYGPPSLPVEYPAIEMKSDT